MVGGPPIPGQAPDQDEVTEVVQDVPEQARKKEIPAEQRKYFEALERAWIYEDIIAGLLNNPTAFHEIKSRVGQAAEDGMEAEEANNFDTRVASQMRRRGEAASKILEELNLNHRER